MSNSEKGFVINTSYEMHNNSAYIYIYGRLECGESFLTINEYNPYFHIRKSDVDAANDILKYFSSELVSEAYIEDSDFKNFKKEIVSKVILRNPKDVGPLRREFENREIVCFEADVKFIQRFLIDKEIQGLITVKGDYTRRPEDDFLINSPFENDDTEFNVNRLYFNQDVTNHDIKADAPNLRILSFDIETDERADKLYSISSYFVDGDSKDSESLIISDHKVKNATAYTNEKDLLEHFRQSIFDFDPDVIIGWNVIDFDLKFMQQYFKRNKVKFDIGRNNRPARLTIKDDFMLDSKANIPGRMVLDGIHLLKISNISLNDYKLDTAASEILNDHKLITGDDNKGNTINDYFYNNKEKLVEYNLKDAVLVYDILEKKDLINLVVTRSKLTGMLLNKVQASVMTLDSLYLKEAKRRHIVCNSVRNITKEEGTLGGYVMDPKAGIHDNIIVMDFKSLYPSIMITFNIDPLLFSPEGTIEAPNGARFLNEDGILPHLIDTIWSERDEAKKRKDDIASYAFKIIINSFYGVLANVRCRFFSLDVANSITHFAQFLIKKTIGLIEEKGHEVIYSDTDSVFIKTGSKSVEDANALGEQLGNEINTFFTKWIKDTYNRDSRLELEFEKVYRKLVFPQARGGDGKGAKKRYAGLLVKGATEKLDFTGLEFVRRDWTEVSKKFQLTLLDKIFHDENPKSFVKEFVEDIKNHKYDDLLVYRKAIRKDLSSYIKTTPPHVKAARKLDKITSNIIKYVMTVDGPEPVQMISHSIDYDHYIEKQIKPIADSVLVFFGTNFDDTIKGTTQKSLFSF